MKAFFVTVAIAATLFASPAFATDCTIGQGRDITFDLAEGPNGTVLLPHTERKNEYTRRHGVAFDLRNVLESAPRTRTRTSTVSMGSPEATTPREVCSMRSR
jgi:hypothetical protein